MRIIFAGAATALLSFAAATPAYAQFGGSPDAQVDGAPNARTQAPAQEDEDDQAVVPDAGDGDDIAAQADGNAKPGADEDQGGAYAEQGDADASVDQGDADTDVDQGDADTGMDQGDVDTDADQGDVDNDVDQGAAGDDTDQAAKPGDGGVAGGGYAAQTWQGEDGRTYCRRSDGTTGLLVGGGAGALVGRGIDGGRHRGAGTIIGAIAGAVIGSAVEQSADRQSCG
jgi:hypothetical protein